MFVTYTRTNPIPLTAFGNLTAGNPPFSGQSVTRPPRGAPAFFRQVQRRYRQTPLEWSMFAETQPSMPAHLLRATSVGPRITADRSQRFRRKNLPPEFIATIGPGLTARPPFVGVAAGPRFTARDFLLRARRYRQIDPRAALSGLTARTVGSFAGSKLGFVTVQGSRSATNFKVAPHRTGTVTVQ